MTQANASEMVERLLTDFYTSPSYLAVQYQCPADIVKAAIDFALSARAVGVEGIAEWLRNGDDDQIEALCEKLWAENKRQREKGVFVGQPYLDLFADAILASLKGEGK